MLTRRTLLGSALVAARGAPAEADEAAAALAALERRCGGQIGVAILDARSGAVLGHRLDQAFPLCSTHKVLTAACVLARVDAGEERLDRRVAYGPEVLVPYSPVTGPQAGRGGLTVAALCDAAVTRSDNTAANLLLDGVGGPAAFTAYLRRLGDPVTRLDRREPELNEARPGDPRDATTPRAMAALLRGLVLGSSLSEPSRGRLDAWMADCRTGLTKIRAGVPAGWRVGDKTGGGGGARHASNDVAVLRPPAGRTPLVVAAYTIDVPGDDAGRDMVLAAVGRIAAATQDGT